jgi:hypothetical protein
MTDVAGFRLAVFTNTVFIERLREVSASLERANAPQLSSVVNELLQDVSPPQDAEAALTAVLLFEAIGWLRLGQRSGYFPGIDALPGMIEPSGVLLQDALELDDLFGPRLGTHGDPDLQRGDTEFGELLLESVVSLTADRREFLLLSYFAPDEEWDNRIGEVENLTNLLAAHPDLIVADSEMDRLTWALQGAEPDEQEGTPSGWRTGWQCLGDAEGPTMRVELSGDMQQRLAYRSQALRLLRNRIVEVAPTLTDDPVKASAIVSRPTTLYT